MSRKGRRHDFVSPSAGAHGRRTGERKWSAPGYVRWFTPESAVRHVFSCRLAGRLRPAQDPLHAVPALERKCARARHKRPESTRDSMRGAHTVPRSTARRVGEPRTACRGALHAVSCCSARGHDPARGTEAGDGSSPRSPAGSARVQEGAARPCVGRQHAVWGVCSSETRRVTAERTRAARDDTRRLDPRPSVTPCDLALLASARYRRTAQVVDAVGCRTRSNGQPWEARPRAPLSSRSPRLVGYAPCPRAVSGARLGGALLERHVERTPALRCEPEAGRVEFARDRGTGAFFRMTENAEYVSMSMSKFR